MRGSLRPSSLAPRIRGRSSCSAVPVWAGARAECAATRRAGSPSRCSCVLLTDDVAFQIRADRSWKPGGDVAETHGLSDRKPRRSSGSGARPEAASGISICGVKPHPTARTSHSPPAGRDAATPAMRTRGRTRPAPCWPRSARCAPASPPPPPRSPTPRHRWRRRPRIPRRTPCAGSAEAMAP